MQNDYIPLNPESYICYLCKHKRFPYSRLWALGPYTGILKQLLLDLKFRNQAWTAVLFAELLSDYPEVGEILKNTDVIIPVPMSGKRLEQRGFNQVYLIAAGLSKIYGFHKRKILTREINRVKSTEFQKNLNLHSRQENIKGAFSINSPGVFNGANALILDDIYTTGSTVKELGRTLRQAGAKSISVLVIAR